MPNINDRIGSQNVIRVLSNASSPPTKLINLTDVDSTNISDGLILVWDLPSQTFIMTSVIDRSTSISDTTVSISTSTGAFTVKGGVGIGQNLNVGAGFRVVGIATFGNGNIVINGSTNNIKVGAALTIDAEDGIFTPSINISGLVDADRLYVSGITTLAATSGMTTTGGDFYSGANAFIGGDLRVEGSSNFIGTATFHGGTINLGDSDTDDINVVGEFISNLVPNVDDTYSIGITTKRWQNAKFSGLVTATDLSISGFSTFAGITTVSGPTLFTRQLSASGVSTFTGITTNLSTLFANQFSVSGLSTFNGITTVSGPTLFTRQFSASGVSTFNGITTSTSTLFANQFSASGVSTFTGITTNLSTLFANQFSVSGVTSLAVNGGITTTGGDLYVGGDLYIADDLRFDEFTARNANITGLSTFVGVATFLNDVFVVGTLTAGLIDGGEY